MSWFKKIVVPQIETVKTLDELYNDRALYSSQDMFSPPAERREHVLRFELTQGCDWGKCTYCTGYENTPFRQKSLDEYKAHVNRIWKKIDKYSKIGWNLKRAFIGGGNALAAENQTLAEAVKYTYRSFPNRYNLKRMSLYGRTTSIAQKGSDFLKKLKDSMGSEFLIYWGLESGSPEVLSYVHKGCSAKQLDEAVDAMNVSSTKSSVMIMTGLGGIRFYNPHVEETIKVLAKLKPKFLTFMGINPCPSSAYSTRIKEEEREGTNRPLTDAEMATQMTEIIDRLPAWDCRIGCFDRKVDGVGHNPFTFGSQYLGPLKEKISFCKTFNEVTKAPIDKSVISC